jgi:hypothetical protein
MRMGQFQKVSKKDPVNERHSHIARTDWIRERNEIIVLKHFDGDSQELRRIVHSNKLTIVIQ